MKRFSGYRALTSKYYRLLLLLLGVAAMVLSFLANVYIGDAGVFIIISLTSCAQIFLDYYVFGGISSRHQCGMEMVKASCLGADLIDSALKTDMYIKAIFNLSGYAGFLAAELIYSDDIGISIIAIMLAVILYPLSNFLTRLILILSRRIAVTMVSQIFVTYLASMLTGLSSIIISFALPEDIDKVVVFGIVVAAIIEGLSVLTAVLLIKDCKKGYISSFYDSAAPVK